MPDKHADSHPRHRKAPHTSSSGTTTPTRRTRMLLEENELGRTMAALAAYNGLKSDRALAEVLAEEGFEVSQQAIWNYEAGHKTPPLGYMVSFVRALQMSDARARKLLNLYLHANP